MSLASIVPSSPPTHPAIALLLSEIGHCLLLRKSLGLDNMHSSAAIALSCALRDVPASA